MQSQVGENGRVLTVLLQHRQLALDRREHATGVVAWTAAYHPRKPSLADSDGGTFARLRPTLRTQIQFTSQTDSQTYGDTSVS